MSMSITIRNGRLLDPANALDQHTDLHIAEGRILALGEAPEGFVAEQEIDAQGCWVMPGIIDLQARLREPGHEHKGTIESESRAAAAGGITTLCMPPDTDPVLDEPAVAEQVRNHAKAADRTWVLPLGALTQGLRGEQLSEMLALKEAGCVAVSNARRAIANTLVQRRAFEYAATLDLTVFLQPEDPHLASGCMHEGPVSTRLGLPGIPDEAEVIALSRDLELVEQTGVRAHFGQLSSARAVERIAEAQARGLVVSADVSAHQLHLTDIDVAGFNSQCHLRPPLRSQRHQDALRAAVADGTIQAICSDHQPHDRDAKLAPFAATEPGLSGLETLLPLTIKLVDEGVLQPLQAVAALTSGPAGVLALKAGRLDPGAPADIAVVDPDADWVLEAASMHSHGKNTPFLDWCLKGRVTHTLHAGRPVYPFSE